MGDACDNPNNDYLACADSPKAIRRPHLLTIAGAHPRLPSWQPPMGLGYVAERYLPGGLKTLMHLAGLSPDERARKVARRWNSLSKPGRQAVAVEALCAEVRIAPCDFAGIVAGTGFELRINIAGLIAHPRPDLESFIQRAVKRANYKAAVAFFTFAGLPVTLPAPPAPTGRVGTAAECIQTLPHCEGPGDYRRNSLPRCS